MSISAYVKRVGRYLLRGVPNRTVYVNVNGVNIGETLKNKNVVVTGGGSGIGYAIAKKCHSEGANVVIIGRNENKLKEACSKIGAERIQYCCFDLTNFEMMQDMVNEVVGLFNEKRIDGFVNNAGIYKHLSIRNTKEADFDAIFNINVKAVYFSTQAILPYVAEQGQILTIASDTAYVHSTNPYHMSKETVVHFTKALAKELLDKRIRANAIAPGPTVSEINKADPEKGLQWEDKLRVLKAEEVAEVAWFLLSDSSNCINGQVICCDEGDCLR